MAKDRYSVPVSLDRSILDHEINLSNKSFQVKPLPMKVIFTYLGSTIVLMWVLTSTPLKGANFGLLALITLWWIAATVYFAAYSKTKEMRGSQLSALFD